MSNDYAAKAITRQGLRPDKADALLQRLLDSVPTSPTSPIKETAPTSPTSPTSPISPTAPTIQLGQGAEVGALTIPLRQFSSAEVGSETPEPIKGQVAEAKAACIRVPSSLESASEQLEVARERMSQDKLTLMAGMTAQEKARVSRFQAKASLDLAIAEEALTTAEATMAKINWDKKKPERVKRRLAKERKWKEDKEKEELNRKYHYLMHHA